MTYLKDQTWTSFESKKGQLLIVPLGSIEQHGPHLPLDTDGVIAQNLALAIHDARVDADLAPLIPVGASGEHSDFAGTLSIGTSALQGLLIELLRDSRRNWDAILFVNGHGGNSEALRSAVAQARYEGLKVAIVGIGSVHGDAHAGRTETSLMLFLEPARVLQGSLEAGNTTSIAELLPLISAKGVRAATANGILGDARGASAAEGQEIFASSLSKALAVCDALMGRD